MWPDACVVNWTQYVWPLASAGTFTVRLHVWSVAGGGAGIGSGTGVAPAGYGRAVTDQGGPRPPRAPGKASSVMYTVPLSSTAMPWANLNAAWAPGGLAGSIGRVHVVVQ